MLIRLLAKKWISYCTVFIYFDCFQFLLEGDLFYFQGEQFQSIALIVILILILIYKVITSMSSRYNRTKTEYSNREYQQDSCHTPFKEIENTSYRNKNTNMEVKSSHRVSQKQANNEIQLINTKGRRQPRRSGFDISVSHISSISDKINALLNQLKEEKPKIADKIIKRKNQQELTKIKQNVVKNQHRRSQFVYEEREIFNKEKLNKKNESFTEEQYDKSFTKNLKLKTQISREQKMKGQHKIIFTQNTNTSDRQIKQKSTKKMSLIGQCKEQKFNLEKGRYKYVQRDSTNHNLSLNQHQPLFNNVTNLMDYRNYNKQKQPQGFQANNNFILKFPKPNFSNFTKFPCKTDRDTKQNTTSKLIQDQINKMKSKIQQNQNIQQKLINKQTINKSQYIQPCKSSRKQQTSKLALILSKQVQLQRKLFSFKSIFQGKNLQIQSQNIYQKLKPQNLNISLSFIKHILKDLFQEGIKSKRQYKVNQNYADFIDIFMQCHKNWDHYTKHSTLLSRLKEENFCTDELDLNQKGYLGVEDLLCFINRFTGKYYHSRDISTLYKRLKLQAKEIEETGLSYQGFQRVIMV